VKVTKWVLLDDWRRAKLPVLRASTYSARRSHCSPALAWRQGAGSSRRLTSGRFSVRAWFKGFTGRRPAHLVPVAAPPNPARVPGMLL
jgi:hypothetical protein